MRVPKKSLVSAAPMPGLIAEPHAPSPSESRRDRHHPWRNIPPPIPQLSVRCARTEGSLGRTEGSLGSTVGSAGGAWEVLRGVGDVREVFRSVSSARQPKRGFLN